MSNLFTPEEIERKFNISLTMGLPLESHPDIQRWMAISVSEYSPNGGRWIIGDILQKYADYMVLSANEYPAALARIKDLQKGLEAIEYAINNTDEQTQALGIIRMLKDIVTYALRGTE